MFIYSLKPHDLVANKSFYYTKKHTISIKRSPTENEVPNDSI